MSNSGTIRKTFIIFALAIMLLSWIIQYPGNAIASNGCQNCKETCQCPKTRGISSQKSDAENPSCDDISSCLDKSSSEIPFNINHTNNLVENQARYDGIIPADVIIHYHTFAYCIEYEFYSPKTPLYVTNSQYRSPPSL